MTASALRRGFTLLEMLVSLALLGVLMVTLNTFLFSMSELWGGGRDKRLFDQHTRAATALVRNATWHPATATPWPRSPMDMLRQQPMAAASQQRVL